jgi:hypothetical protein
MLPAPRRELAEVSPAIPAARTTTPALPSPARSPLRVSWTSPAGRFIAPVPFRQPVAAYIEQFHSTFALAREWMPPGESAVFDRAIEKIVRPYAAGGMLELEALAEVAWERPTAKS